MRQRSLWLLAAALCAGCVTIERTGGEPGADGDAAMTPDGLGLCTTGALRCEGGEVQHCQGETWTLLYACPSAYHCVDGNCECIKGSCADRECGGDGCGNSCGDCAAGLACAQGQCVDFCAPDCDGRACGSDGCGGYCGQCPADRACDDGACVDGRSCRQALDCAGACLDGDDPNSCVAACLEGATGQAQTEYVVYVTCANSSGCADLGCLANQCGSQYAACLFDTAGDRSCQEVLTCQNGCGDDLGCAAACADAGTSAAQTAYASLTLCLQGACPSLRDYACVNAALIGACADHASACGIVSTGAP